MATTAKSVAAQSTQDMPTTAAAQQSDNVAHALAGAGGGILSTALTYGTSDSPRLLETDDNKIPLDHIVHSRTGRVQKGRHVCARCSSPDNQKRGDRGTLFWN